MWYAVDLVAERERPERLLDHLGARRRVEHQVDHRVDRAVLAEKGVVEQVVEDRPVLLGLGPVIGQEPLGGAGPVLPLVRRRVAQPDRQGPLIFEVAGHLVRLPVEHGLQPVLDPAEEAVRVDHDPALLGGQAADRFEPGERDRGVGVADLGVLAAVEELQELDDELDVANPAMPGLDLDGGRPRRDRPLLDPPLHRLDLADLGPTEVAAVDERGDRGEEVGPRSRSPATARHLIRACRSQVRPEVW